VGSNIFWTLNLKNIFRNQNTINVNVNFTSKR